MVKELFVYGTLMQHTDSAMARFLQARASALGMAYLPGRLYDLGSYPGAIYDPNETNLITGQIYQLISPEDTFPVLDQYEGVTASPSPEEEYVRRLVTAQLDQQPISCWIYQYNLATHHLPLIPSGNYLDYFAHQNKHRLFISNGR